MLSCQCLLFQRFQIIFPLWFQSQWRVGVVVAIDDNYRVITLFHFGNENLPLCQDNWRIIVTTNFSYNRYDIYKYYPGEPVNINMQSLINIIQDNN